MVPGESRTSRCMHLAGARTLHAASRRLRNVSRMKHFRTPHLVHYQHTTFKLSPSLFDLALAIAFSEIYVWARLLLPTPAPA